ncbi:MAG: hypothetical protein V7L14_21710 [Nostoc sp.]|uniref:hypothetical protein n=1 Tax=Nostoc sp. TaxID=1180 RepID=UPI002FF9CC04
MKIVYALWGEPIAAVKEGIAEVRAALPPGRSVGFSVSLRPILGATEQQVLLKRRSLNFTNFRIWATCNYNLIKIYRQNPKINIDLILKTLSAITR